MRTARGRREEKGWREEKGRLGGREFFVRVSGGEFRGQKLRTPGEGTHPMGERERIALFNMLSSHISGGCVVDLFCGGGTLGIEALSRGAASVVLVDSSPKAIEVARWNLQKLGIDAKHGRAILSSAERFLGTEADQYDLVIADPPYDKYDGKILEGLPRLVRGGGIVVLSHPGEAPELTDAILEKSRSYAGATISVYRKMA